MCVGVFLFIENDLYYSFAVAEVNEGKRPEVTAFMNPTHQTYDFARVLGS
jgi:hypothetical protein